jgi:hypothetical protein
MDNWRHDYIAVIALGLGLLGAVCLCLSGKYKGWARDHRGPTAILALFPGAGLVSLVIGVEGLLDISSQSTPWIMILAAVLTVAAFVVTVLEPSWWGPKWYRQYMGIGTRKEPGKIGRHPVVEPIYRDGSGARVRKPRNPIHRALDDEQPIDQWQATVIDDWDGETGYRGRLALYPEGLAFLEHGKGGDRRKEDGAERVGFEMLGIDIAGIDILSEATLSESDKPDAKVRRLRPAVPWVVVRMRDQDGAYFFSVTHPKAAARRISEHLGYDLVDDR